MDESTSKIPCCRICLQTETSLSNPLISPCNCSGTMKFLHVECLQKWLKNKSIFRENETTLTTLWKELECDICKKPLPYSVMNEGKSFEVIEIQRPEGMPYIMLEILGKEKNQVRGIHIITPFIRNYAQLGRGHEADVRITDISVSRWHSVIKFENQRFILEDINSKFGTLVLAKNPVPINIGNKAFGVQIGKTVLYLSTHKRWRVCDSFICGGAIAEVNESVHFLRTHLENQKSKQGNKTHVQEDDPIINNNPQVEEDNQELLDLSNNSEEQQELIQQEELDQEEEQKLNYEQQQDQNQNNILQNESLQIPQQAQSQMEIQQLQQQSQRVQVNQDEGQNNRGLQF